MAQAFKYMSLWGAFLFKAPYFWSRKWTSTKYLTLVDGLILGITSLQTGRHKVLLVKTGCGILSQQPELTENFHISCVPRPGAP